MAVCPVVMLVFALFATNPTLRAVAVAVILGISSAPDDASAFNDATPNAAFGNALGEVAPTTAEACGIEIKVNEVEIKLNPTSRITLAFILKPTISP